MNRVDDRKTLVGVDPGAVQHFVVADREVEILEICRWPVQLQASIAVGAAAELNR